MFEEQGKKVWIFVIKFGNHTPFSACFVPVSLAPVDPLEKVQGTEQEQQKELQNVSSPDVSFFFVVVFVVVECTVFVLHWLEFNFLISCSFHLYIHVVRLDYLFIVKGRFFCIILLGSATLKRNWTIARWRHFTTTTRILQFVVFLCKLGLLFFNPQRDWQISITKQKRNKFW